MIRDKHGAPIEVGSRVEFVYGGDVHRATVLAMRRPPAGEGAHGELEVELRVWVRASAARTLDAERVVEADARTSRDAGLSKANRRQDKPPTQRTQQRGTP